MSRRNRGPRPQQTQHNPSPHQQLSAPVVVQVSKLTIGDIKVFAALAQQAKDGKAGSAEALLALPGAIDMLDRVVVGGVSHRPINEMWPIIAEVNRQMKQAGNPGN